MKICSGRRVACEVRIIAADTAASTVGKTTKGNQGNEESLGKPKVQILVFFAAFCKDLYCHYSHSRSIAPNLPFSSVLYEPSRA
jgi:hypothetical protein